MTDFIDFHVHPPVTELLGGPIAPYLEPLEGRIDTSLETLTVDEVAANYRDRNGKAVLLGWDAETVTKQRPFSSADVAAMVAAHPDVFYGFGSIDPARGAGAVAGVHSAARLGLIGLAFHPIGQGFDPSSRLVFNVYEAAADHGLICLFHTGYSRLGSGMPGGTGLKLSHGAPAAVDHVAATFPNLQIVIAHLGRLWRDEAVAVAAHKSNVWLNLVGSTPKGCMEDLDALAALDFDRCLFGSDWCFASLDDALAAWQPGSVDETVRRRVLHDNAIRLLGLAGN
ncbi:MAG: amidohydrolase family protein [Acidimicrobiia bacterium]